MSEYKFNVNGDPYEVKIDGIENGIANVSVNGKALKIDIESCGSARSMQHSLSKYPDRLRSRLQHPLQNPLQSPLPLQLPPLLPHPLHSLQPMYRAPRLSHLFPALSGQ